VPPGAVPTADEKRTTAQGETLKTTDQKPKPQLGLKAHDKPRQAREEAAAQYLTSIKMNNFASIPGTQLLARPWKIAISDSLVPEHFCSARATLANRF
jgi:hypothetical protein